jgi:hypothetical protein
MNRKEILKIKRSLTMALLRLVPPRFVIFLLALMMGISFIFLPSPGSADGLTFVVVDTGQENCYDQNGRTINAPDADDDLYGQDAQYEGNQPAYEDNGDGTITDLNTGLIWQKTPPNDIYEWDEALEYASDLELAGKKNWRLPSIKELLSIAQFIGNARELKPYLDDEVFDYYQPGNFSGQRDMDGQYWSRTDYVGTTMRNDDSAFGFNFADGRIKAYPKTKGNYVRCVRGNQYGVNDFENNNDGTITDNNTGLMWMKWDSGETMDWPAALEYAENLEYAGYDDWRLPNAKELQSIVDYTRAPDSFDESRQTAAIKPMFSLTETESWFWTGTTLTDATDTAIYVAFGRGTAYNDVNVHGAGCMRSDPKVGDPADYPNGRGPQSDEIRIYNYVRCVRDVTPTDDGGGDDGGDTGGGSGGGDGNTKTIDLTVDSLSLNRNSFSSGETVRITTRIENEGSGPSESTQLKLYFSRETSLNDRAKLHLTRHFGGLARWHGRTVTMQLRLPPVMPSGKHYLHLVVDDARRNDDMNWQNNASYVSFTIN